MLRKPICTVDVQVLFTLRKEVHDMLTIPERAAEIAEHEAKHSEHGYSQPNRAAVGTGGAATEKITLSDGTNVRIAKGDRDCTSLSIECYAAQGVDCGNAWYSLDMRKGMVNSGNFKAIKVTSSSTWKNAKVGDILLTEKNRHAAVVVGSGYLVEALSSENSSTHGRLGDQTGREVWKRKLYNDGWQYVLRYIGPDPAKDTESKIWQTEEDGKWGSDTTAIAQAIEGIIVSGKVYNQRESDKKCLLGDQGSSFVYEKKPDKGGSLLIRRIQNDLGIPWSQCTGYFDSTTSRKFIKAWVKNPKDTYKIADPSSVIKNWQKDLNKKAKSMKLKKVKY